MSSDRAGTKLTIPNLVAAERGIERPGSHAVTWKRCLRCRS
jgi:hypothetical protein